MKKKLSIFILLVTSLLLVACGEGDSTDTGSTDNETVEIKVGATSVPHAELLEEVTPLLAEQGIELTIETYTDYALPNEDLSRGELDANFFQHIPFFEAAIDEKGYDIVNLGGVHIEPIGVYSKGIASVDDIKEGTEVIISRNVPDHGRILSLFEANGLITLDENVTKSVATVDDIIDNPLNLTFSPDVNPEFLVQAYENEEDTLVVINANYAIEADLSPLDDALFFEGDDSQYVNIVVARAEDEDNEALQKLVEALQSEEIHEFINEQYGGEVFPYQGDN
ncbi:MetQ/NlpA family ABC transporter substrate-binding protein [Amphibacillus sp. MSJ-3]|uniref:MetQ/NlpA family ABC transporter substrate-binding protein n=1 Tax=Amphibacillus sp. MSJ-3 TaxID=2841505 RepID=UPI001C0F389E|nr:MetQ/NlpA family ABC transporter substrate-binding protein [Amphibacillus sp. MSJ-3]MBU5595619.1 MetQ/NlpA family ABC transporter substrate-binding protein [Amphibacillus sp. MSJ-3]